MVLANTLHAVCIPFPTQDHIIAMLNLAKLLHHRGFHMTFVNTEFTHKHLLQSMALNSLDGLPENFQFETIPDGLPPSDTPQDFPSLCDSSRKNLLAPFRRLLAKLNHSSSTTASSNVPPVICIVSDFILTFATIAAEELGIPVVLLSTIGACGFMGYKQYRALMERGLTPLKDVSYLTNGYLDTIVDWIPGMKDMRLRDLPSLIRTTDPNDLMFNFVMGEIERASKAPAIVIHTFNELKKDVLDALDALSSMFTRVYAIGPLELLLKQIPDDHLKSIGASLWKEEHECLEWLNSKEPKSVVYVNFGWLVVMTPQQLVEFGWGLANSNRLWIIRPDLVAGESAILPLEFVEETKERGLIASWCPQEQFLSHPSIGGFLTPGGWNSIIESLSSGVPMICWPIFGDQQTNCRYCCTEWGVGIELDDDVKRDEVERLVRELMEGEKGKKMKNKAMERKKMAEEATSPTGSSSLNLDKLVNEVLLSKWLARDTWTCVPTCETLVKDCRS